MLGVGAASALTLTPVERSRAADLAVDADRDDFVAARLLLRLAAARLLGVRARRVRLTQCCPTCGGPHGPVTIDGRPEVGVSLSHAAGRVAAIAGRHAVAVDVEPVSAHTDRRWWASVLSEAELAQLPQGDGPAAQAFTRWWVRKECLVKAGAARLDGLRDVDLARLGPEPNEVPTPVDHPLLEPCTTLVDWSPGPPEDPAQPAHVGAACVRGTDWQGWDDLDEVAP